MPADYAETRAWVIWLRVFTANDLADAMAVTPESIEGFVKGLEQHGTITPAGVYLNGNGPETMYEWVPLPPGPREHPHKIPPEKLVGYTEVLCPRGLPVRIRSERMMRRILSTSGAAAVHRRREARYQKMQEAVAKRRERDRAKAAGADPQEGFRRKAKHKARTSFEF